MEITILKQNQDRIVQVKYLFDPSILKFKELYMALKDSISDIKNHAMNNIIHILASPSNYCWQEETPEGRRIDDIENVVRVMKLEIDAVKEKYKRKEATNETI